MEPIKTKTNFKKIEFDNLNNEITIEAGVNMQELLEKALRFNRSLPIGLSGEKCVEEFKKYFLAIKSDMNYSNAIPN